jgi:hypothetical protein
MDYREQNYDPPDGETDAGFWQVHLAVTPEDFSAIKRVAATVVPLEHLEFHTELTAEGEGDRILAIRVHARVSSEALLEASYVYDKLRAAADLTQEPPVALGYISPSWRQGSVHRQLASEAHELHRQGRHELAIIRIQTACELRIAETVQHLLQDAYPDGPIKPLIRRPATLRDKHTQTLLHLLTGEAVQDSDWWPDYVAHLERRNAIVHSGLEVTWEDASATMAVTNKLYAWLLHARGVEVADEDG